MSSDHWLILAVGEQMCNTTTLLPVIYPDEDAVRRYFELHGYFVRTNVTHDIRAERGMVCLTLISAR